MDDRKDALIGSFNQHSQDADQKTAPSIAEPLRVYYTPTIIKLKEKRMFFNKNLFAISAYSRMIPYARQISIAYSIEITRLVLGA